MERHRIPSEEQRALACRHQRGCEVIGQVLRRSSVHQQASRESRRGDFVCRARGLRRESVEQHDTRVALCPLADLGYDGVDRRAVSAIGHKSPRGRPGFLELRDKPLKLAWHYHSGIRPTTD